MLANLILCMFLCACARRVTTNTFNLPSGCLHHQSSPLKPKRKTSTKKLPYVGPD